MKIKTGILLSAASFAAYKIYQHRHLLQDKIENSSYHFKEGQKSFNAIQDNLTRLSQEEKYLKEVGQDIAYKTRVFATESQAILNEIQLKIQEIRTNSSSSNIK